MDLLEQSSNEEYYFPYNIWKKLFGKNFIEGGKRISWFATRQLEKFDAINEFQDLKRVIEDKNSDEILVNRVYFSLGHLAKNTNSKEVFDYLMSRLKIESEGNVKTILISVINCLKPAYYDLNAIYDLIRDSNIQIKTDAVCALKNSENEASEHLLIERFMIEKNKNLKSSIASTLGNIGSLKFFSLLSEELKVAKGTDYKYFLKNAISKIYSKNNH